MSVLGETPKERISLTTHFFQRWCERIADQPKQEINDIAKTIIKMSERQQIGEDDFSICTDGIVIILKKISPLHVLGKTVYVKDTYQAS